MSDARMDALEVDVAAAQAGDQTAFAALLQGEVERGHRIAYMVLRDRTAADDAFQDACLRAWRDIHRLRDRTLWQPWFRRIVLNAARDQGRRQRRLREVPLVDDTTAPDRVDALAGHVDLEAAYLRLEIRDRVLLALRYGMGLDVAELAAALDIPSGTAKARIHRTLVKLRGHLGE
jgi:RNA polymerase sigma-70 factor (ECF subfamily)